MSQIDDRLKALDAERDALLALKAVGNDDPKVAVQAAVKLIDQHLTQAKMLANAFSIDFSITMDDYRTLQYDSDRKAFWSDDGWSSSSMSC